MTENRTEPLFHCDIRGCVGVAAWLYMLDGDAIRLCTRHWDVIEEGPIQDAD